MSIFGKSGRTRKATSRPGKSISLTVEALEDRQVPTALGWTTGVNLPSPESAVSALPSGGRILLFGNAGTQVESLASGASAWTSTGSIDIARSSPGVAFVQGKLLVFGGFAPSSGAATDSTIDINSGTAVGLSPMNSPRQSFAYTTDWTYAYAIGGIDDVGTLLNSIERYDPIDDSWTNLSPLPQALSGSQAVYGGAGKIYVFGGSTASGVSSAVYSYDIASDTWTLLPAMPVGESAGAAILGNDGIIDVVGGIGATGNSIATVQRFDPATQTWSVDTPLPTPISEEAIAIDNLGRIEVIGGSNRQGASAVPSSTVYVSDLAPTFASTPPANPTVVVGTTLTYTASASGTPAPTFSLVNPPAGASIDAATGAFSFTPSLGQTGTVQFDIRASNGFASADQTFSATVKAPAPTGVTVTGASLTSISLSWNASGGPVAYYRVYMDGQLPQFDIVADKVAGTTATIVGLASQIAGHTFYVTSFDQAGNESLFSAPIVGHTWTAGALQYTSNYGYYLSLPATHTLIIQLSNPGANPAPTSYAIVSGAPAGMTIDRTTGVITWTPTNAQALAGYFPVVSSTNAAGVVTLRLGIAVQYNYPAITVSYPGTTGSTAYANLPFQLKFNDSSGAAVSWKLTAAPAGATLSSDGSVHWTPTKAQALAASSVTFSVTATNYAGSSSFSVTVPLQTLAAPSNLTYVANRTAGTLDASWAASAFSALPVASYQVTLSYVYYTSSGSGRGGGRSFAHGGSWTVKVPAGSPLSASFSGVPILSLPANARFTLSVQAFDTAGTASPATVKTFTRP